MAVRRPFVRDRREAARVAQLRELCSKMLPAARCIREWPPISVPQAQEPMVVRVGDVLAIFSAWLAGRARDEKVPVVIASGRYVTDN